MTSRAGADDAIEEKARRPKDLVQRANITLISQQSPIPSTKGFSSASLLAATYADGGSSQMALVIYNPVGGDSTAKQFVEGHVLPLLKTSDVPIAKIVETEHAGHAGTIAFEFVDSTVLGRWISSLPLAMGRYTKSYLQSPSPHRTKTALLTPPLK
jgi:hypothetical protein